MVRKGPVAVTFPARERQLDIHGRVVAVEAPEGITPGMCGLDIGAEYTDEQREFLVAVDRYKREHHRPHPALTEVLAVFKALGYKKVVEGC